MSDIGYRTKVYSDIRYNVGLGAPVRYRTFRYQAQSDIADHGYWTECPPMPMGIYYIRHYFQSTFFSPFDIMSHLAFITFIIISSLHFLLFGVYYIRSYVLFATTPEGP